MIGSNFMEHVDEVHYLKKKFFVTTSNSFLNAAKRLFGPNEYLPDNYSLMSYVKNLFLRLFKGIKEKNSISIHKSIEQTQSV